MKCPYCKEELPDDSKFCTECGELLQAKGGLNKRVNRIVSIRNRLQNTAIVIVILILVFGLLFFVCVKCVIDSLPDSGPLW